MSVAGYELKISGGGYTNAVFDVGNLTSKLLSTIITVQEATVYTVAYRAYDNWGNRSAWSASETITSYREPVDISALSNIKFYFEADLESFSNNDPVGQVTNQVAAVHPASSGTSRPVFIASEPALNNKPCVSFDGVNDYLYAYQGDTITDYTIGFVYAGLTASDYLETIFSGQSNSDAFSPSGANHQFNLVGIGSAATLLTLPAKGVIAVKVSPSANNVKVWINDTKVIDGGLSASLTGISFACQYYLGTYAVSTFCTVKIAMAFMTHGLLSDAQIGQIIEDMNVKYDLF